MPTEGATAIVFNADRTHVLLVKREDFRVWVLPGGKYFSELVLAFAISASDTF